MVAWSPDPFPGQVISPKVDRHRGVRLIVVHLAFGPPPDPSKPPYYHPADAAQERTLEMYFKPDSRNPNNATPQPTP